MAFEVPRRWFIPQFPTPMADIPTEGPSPCSVPQATLLRRHSLESTDVVVLQNVEPHYDRLDLSIQTTSDFELEGLLGEVDTWMDENTVDIIAGVPTQAKKESPQLEYDDLQPKSTRGIRVTPKRQIRELQQSVNQLTLQLQELKASQLSTEGNDGSRSQLTRPSTVRLWQQSTVAECAKRQKAEQENAQLRAILLVQLEEARSLKRSLKRRTKTKMLENMLGIKRSKKISSAVTTEPNDNAKVFQRMIRDSDEFYVGVDSLFTEKGFSELRYPGQKTNINRKLVGDGIYLEMMIQHVLPFGFRDAEKAVWVCLSDMGLSTLVDGTDTRNRVHFHAQHTESSRNTVACSFFAATPDQKGVSGVQTRQVVRKYIKENRAVFIHQSLGEPKLEGSNSSVGIQMLNVWRITVEHQAKQNNRDAASVLRLHFTASSRDMWSTGANFWTPASLNMTIAYFESTNSRLPDAVEDILVDKSVGNTST
ncbi:hypothetical protein F441_12876 [Phytophthora nicotianae CJ01A1]|uniref:Uncharacterized protein n=1 Tax=Phytophthora nicotianae CJ01A1 TaxID=1317063 RepID=W2WM43_PHYNI|nr:hypothetical protein F441_12876 [Phytophthora nicotianae CJ01A1]